MVLASIIKESIDENRKMLDFDHLVPADTKVNASILSRVFSNTTGTYKFYWFLSLLELVCKHNQSRFSDHEVVAQMVAKAWYPRVYFRLSFGFQEKLASVIDSLHERADDREVAKHSATMADHLLESDCLTTQMCRTLTRHVPTRFLNPWLHTDNDSEIKRLSRSFHNNCLYAIVRDRNGWSYEINPLWLDYLKKHYSVLSDFTHWHLLRFLQQRNPNVPNIADKLVATDQRPSMTEQRKFWSFVMQKQHGVESLYSGAILQEMRRCDLDHFLPWSFVAHNQLWNLVPVETSINCRKSDRLPDLALLPKMAEIQRKAVHTFVQFGGKGKLLEDFCDLGIDTRTLLSLNDQEFFNLFSDTFAPMRQIALNMGFEEWKPKDFKE